MPLKSATFALFCLTSAANAGQPISESMVHCGALYSVAGSWMRTDEKAEKLYTVSDEWADAAIERAAVEGRSDPQGYVSSLWGGKCEAVASKGKAYVFSQDFRDWMGYCRALGRKMNVSAQP